MTAAAHEYAAAPGLGDFDPATVPDVPADPADHDETAECVE